MWTDQDQKRKRLNSIQVAIDNEKNWTSRLRVAFNGKWCEWRETARNYDSGDPLEETIVEATTFTHYAEDEFT